MPKIAQPLIVAATLALLAACSNPQPSPPPASMAPPPGPMAAPAPPMEEPYVAPSTARRHHVVRHHRKAKKVRHIRHRRAAKPAAMAPAPMAPAPMAPAPSPSQMPGPRPSGR